MNTDGQKVSFYIYNSDYWRSRNYIEYYARVISPGTYTAQGPIIQGKTSRDNINVGRTEIVTIEASEAISTPTENPPVPTPTPDDGIEYGDLNGDSQINSTDYMWLKRYILKLVSEFPVSSDNADLNGDGQINTTDLIIMKRYLLRIIPEFPVVNQQN